MAKTSRHQAPSLLIRILIPVIALVAVVVCLLLLWDSVSGNALPGCGPGNASGCSSVLASRWATVLGVPVSALALIPYIFIFAASLHISGDQPIQWQQIAWKVLIVASFIAVASAAWFTVLMFLDGTGLCPYCLTVHACGAVLLVLVVINGPITCRGNAIKAPQIGLATITQLAALAILAVGLLTTCQLLKPPQMESQVIAGLDDVVTDGSTNPSPNIDSEFLLDGKKRQHPPAINSRNQNRVAPSLSIPNQPTKLPPNIRKVVVHDSQGKARAIQFNPLGLPIHGSPYAKKLMLCLFDYTCKHCRIMHNYLKLAQSRYGDQFAIIALPAPLDSTCNAQIKETHKSHKNACELAKLALRIWRINQDVFRQFDHWMFESDEPRTLEEAYVHASQLVGYQPLEKARKDPWPARQIANNIELQKILPSQSLPALIFGQYFTKGSPANAKTLFDWIEQDPDMQPIHP